MAQNGAGSHLSLRARTTVASAPLRLPVRSCHSGQTPTSEWDGPVLFEHFRRPWAPNLASRCISSSHHGGYTTQIGDIGRWRRSLLAKCRRRSAQNSPAAVSHCRAQPYMSASIIIYTATLPPFSSVFSRYWDLCEYSTQIPRAAAYLSSPCSRVY